MGEYGLVISWMDQILSYHCQRPLLIKWRVSFLTIEHVDHHFVLSEDTLIVDDWGATSMRGPQGIRPLTTITWELGLHMSAQFPTCCIYVLLYLTYVFL